MDWVCASGAREKKDTPGKPVESAMWFQEKALAQGASSVADLIFSIECPGPLGSSVQQETNKMKEYFQWRDTAIKSKGIPHNSLII